jgi:hypothetical protein
MNDAQLAIAGLAAALESSGRTTGRSYTEVYGRLTFPHRAEASITFRFPPGWVLPKDVEAFARELYDQLHADQAAWMDPPDPRTQKLLDLANRMITALRHDQSSLQVAISDGVLRDHWPAGVVAVALRENEIERERTRLERSMGLHWKRQLDALKRRTDSLRSIRAMRVNPADPRRPA